VRVCKYHTVGGDEGHPETTRLEHRLGPVRISNVLLWKALPAESCGDGKTVIHLGDEGCVRALIDDEPNEDQQQEAGCVIGEKSGREPGLGV
jgi:hypothetical protein